ncbi:putative F-box protein At1g32420 [Papaver somniferum]|uniref:putative F-box protein At1g32420 n=1 Tax=Papaver somniferum TaxID=3469 RepID=UPI000E700FC9|nr:putative F-box protein At1g32420 [Papaver somniferum]
MKSIRVSGDFDDNIYGEILSRLPVKSLVRFKCVSKGWQSMISNDNYFIDLHLSRTKTRSSSSTLFVIVRTAEERTVVSMDLLNDVPAVIRFPIQLTRQEGILKPVNGLICSYYKDFDLGRTAVCIRNFMTREETPWIEVPTENTKKKVYFQTIEHGFGFDVTTKEHKVISIRQTHIKASGKMFCYIVCKVMNVGRKHYSAWRMIDDFPAYMIQGNGIFVNRSLYWLGRSSIPTSNCQNKSHTKYIGRLSQVIVAFDVPTEQFRSIPIPNFIMNQTDGWYSFKSRVVYIIEVDGHIALIDQLENIQIAKLWIFDEDGSGHQKIAANATIGGRDGNWIEETILMPFGHSELYRYFFESITGTNKLVIRMSMVNTTFYTLYLYDRENKTFMQVEISGMPRNICAPSDLVVNFTESLLPVPKKQQEQ